MGVLTALPLRLIRMLSSKVLLILQFQNNGKDDHQSLNDIVMYPLGKVLDSIPMLLDQRWVCLFTGKVGRKLGYVVCGQPSRQGDSHDSMLCLGLSLCAPPLSSAAFTLDDSLEHRRSVVAVVRMVGVIGSILELFI